MLQMIHTLDQNLETNSHILFLLSTRNISLSAHFGTTKLSFQLVLCRHGTVPCPRQDLHGTALEAYFPRAQASHDDRDGIVDTETRYM